MQIHPYYQRQKCSPGIAVSSEIKFGYSQGFAGQGASNESGVVKNGVQNRRFPPRNSESTNINVFFNFFFKKHSKAVSVFVINKAE